LGENFNLRWYRFNRGSASPDSYAGVNWVMGEQDNLIYSFDPDITKATEEIKAIGIVKETTGYLAYRSELIIFTNESEVPNEESINKISDLTIYFEDESDGNYFIYN
jgi:hypothetical protein